MNRVTVHASLLAVEHGNTVKEWKRVERFVNGAHIDIMDGRFVRQKTRFTPALLRSLKTRKWKDVHLMVARPEKMIAAYARAGADAVTIHYETLARPLTMLLKMRRQFPKLKIFIALNPETPATVAFPALPLIDGVLCMTVRPGLGGQKFIGSVLPKIRAIRKRAPRLPIMVDGGVNEKTATRAWKAGATILVSGHYLFHAKDVRTAVNDLKIGGSSS